MHPDARVAGLGAAPRARTVVLYQQAGYHLIYGTFHDRLSLVPFYEAAG